MFVRMQRKFGSFFSVRGAEREVEEKKKRTQTHSFPLQPTFKLADAGGGARQPPPPPPSRPQHGCGCMRRPAKGQCCSPSPELLFIFHSSLRAFRPESYRDFKIKGNLFDFKLITVIKRFSHKHWPKSAAAFITLKNCSGRSQANAFPARLPGSADNSPCVFIKFHSSSIDEKLI